MAKMGRPRKAKYDAKNLEKTVREYMDSRKPNEPFILKEWCLDNKLNRTYMEELCRDNRNSEYTDFKVLKQELFDRKEVWLEKELYKREKNLTGIVFSLKQPCCGWRDKTEVDVKSENLNINVISYKDGE